LGSLHKIILGTKNMQNLVQFLMTSKFDSEYLQNGWRYSKSDKCIFYCDSSYVVWRKLSKLWSTNHGDLVVKSYPPKSTFLEDHILAPKGCCSPKLWHMLEDDQVLLAHSHWAWGPPYNFFTVGVKIRLKFSVWGSRFLEPGGVA